MIETVQALSSAFPMSKTAFRNAPWKSYRWLAVGPARGAIGMDET